jgi:hypothetical protein
VLTNEHITGNLNANGAASVAICGSTIGGSVNISNTTGPVLVGDGGDDGSPGCAGNTVGNGVTLNNNTANTELGGNQVNANVRFTNNTGPLTSIEDGPEIEANHVGGTLICTGNTPAPGNDNLPNTVGGARSGQCASTSF